jgi:hypothetical protein
VGLQRRVNEGTSSERGGVVMRRPICRSTSPIWSSARSGSAALDSGGGSLDEPRTAGGLGPTLKA